MVEVTEVTEEECPVSVVPSESFTAFTALTAFTAATSLVCPTGCAGCLGLRALGLGSGGSSAAGTETLPSWRMGEASLVKKGSNATALRGGTLLLPTLPTLPTLREEVAA